MIYCLIDLDFLFFSGSVIIHSAEEVVLNFTYICNFVFPTFNTVLFCEALLITLCSTNKRSSSISCRRSFSHSNREVVVAGLSKELLRPGERRLHMGPLVTKYAPLWAPLWSLGSRKLVALSSSSGRYFKRPS